MISSISLWNLYLYTQFPKCFLPSPGKEDNYPQSFYSSSFGDNSEWEHDELKDGNNIHQGRKREENKQLKMKSNEIQVFKILM